MTNTLTKAELAEVVYQQCGGVSKREASSLVDMVFETIKGAVAALPPGEKLKLSGFGNFVVRDKSERPGRNPRNGDPKGIAARRVVTFQASALLKQQINSGR